MTADRLPRSLRRRAREAALTVPPRRCWCGRPVPESSLCGCCCAEHDDDVNATAAALLAIGKSIPPPARTDGGPSLREYLASKGEL